MCIRDSNNDSRTNANFPNEQTERTLVRLGDFYANGGPLITIEDDANTNADQPTITGVGPGAVFGSGTCNGCIVDIYVSGSVNGDGTVSPGPAANSWTALVATHSNKCVDITGNSSSNGADSIQDGCDLDSGQRLDFVPVGNGFTLRPQSSGKCLQVTGGSNSNNAVVEQQPCDNGADQRLQWSGNSKVFAHSGKCLEVQNASTQNGARLIQNTCDGDENQRFHFGNTINSTWLGSVRASSNGTFSMASSALQQNVVVWAVATTPDGASSIPSGHVIVKGSGYGLGSNPSAPLPAPAAPDQPLPPIPYQPSVFDCGANGGTLSWTNVGANEYFVFATTNGNETYLGGHSGTSLSVDGADSYRVTEWSGGFANTTTCAGPGPSAPAPAFSCTSNGNLLSWSDEGANEYFVRTVNGGTETFVGGFGGLSATVPGADSYIVIHWTGGRNEATCSGSGGGQQPTGFTCSINGNTLTWTDEGAAEYFVRTVVDGVETFVGGFGGTSATVAGADSYIVIHWTGGRNETTCSGSGPVTPAGFSCSVSGSILSWSDEGASTYFVRTVTNGEEVFFNGFQALSATVPAADSYKVIHWVDGRNETSCS